MADRTVTVTLRASIADYSAKLAAASRATTDLANKVEMAKGRAAQGYATIGKGMVVAGGLVVAGFGEAIKAAAEFDSRMALVQTLSKATSTQMGQLRDAALHVGQAYGYTANDVADAEAELVKAGISVKDMMGGALVGALTLASAGQMNVADATQVAASAMVQFGLKGKDVPHIADLLASGADKALGSVQDLGEGLKMVGTTAHLMGISIEETVGTLAAFANAGQLGSMGGTELNQMLLKLSAPSKSAAAIMEQLGINAYDASGNFVGLANFAGQLHDKLGVLTQAERTHDEAVIFGSRAIKAANILYQEGAAGVEKWTKAVDDAGFAELQASGKLNSLSGDWQKFQAAVTAALIGTGESSQGVLRSMVQDATSAVEMWNNLPGPVKEVMKDIVLLGGAVTLTGGLALLSVSKWRALNVALEDAGVGAISARSALMGIGKAGAVGTVVLGIAYGVDKLAESVGHAVPKLSQIEDSLTSFARSGQVGGALLTLYGQKLHYLGDDLKAINDPSTMDTLERAFDVTRIFGQGKLNTIDLSTQRLDALDKALAALALNGHADLARQAFDRLTEAEVAQGHPTQWLTSHLNDYADAVAQTRTAAQVAAHSQQDFAAAMANAARRTGQATDAAKTYNDALHALYDPVFAFSQALDDARSKQQAYNKAVKQSGPDSRQARQALVDVASATLNVSTNANALAAALKDNPALMQKFINQLDQWKSHGQVTGAEVDGLTGIVKNLLVQADRLNGSTYTFGLHGDNHQALSEIDAVKRALAGLHGRTVRVRAVSGATHISTDNLNRVLGNGHADGGWVGGSGAPRADDQLIRASSREFVVNAHEAPKNAALLEAINSGARIDALPAQRAASTAPARPAPTGHTFNTVVNYPEPEKASESVPRVLRDSAIRTGAAW